MVNRVTILTDRIGNAKGYAYIEFEKADAAVSAVLLDGTELRGRQIKVNCSQSALALHVNGHLFSHIMLSRCFSASALSIAEW